MEERHITGKRFIKYLSIPYLEDCLDILDSEVYVFEKLDGSNCQIRVIDGRIAFGSRARYLEGIVLREGHGWFRDFSSWVWRKGDLYNIPPHLILYGEWLHLNQIKYDNENMNDFYLLDVYDLEKGKFIPYDEAVEEIKRHNVSVNVLRILGKGKFDKESLKRILHEESDYYHGIKEGLVLKDYANQRFAKMYHPRFSEVVEGEGIPLNQKYVTPSRVFRVQQRLREEGKKDSIEVLVQALQKDIEKTTGVSLTEKDIRQALSLIRDK